MSYQQLVEQHHRVIFRDNVHMVAQQKTNPLRDVMTIVEGKGEFMSVADLIGEKKYQRLQDRNRRNIDNPTPRSRRGIQRPDEIGDGEYIDKATKWDAAMDPTSPLFQGMIATIRRGEFDAMLGVVEKEDGTFDVGEGGVYGQSNEGKLGQTKVSLPASQFVEHADTGLTLEKLRFIKKSLRKSNFSLEMEPQFVGLIGPDQEDDLIGIAAATNTSLNAFTLEQLREGKATRLMGFDWLISNRIPVDSAGRRLCAFWNKENMVAAEWEALYGDIWNDTHARNLPTMQGGVTIASTRIEDKGVYIAPCVEEAA